MKPEVSFQHGAQVLSNVRHAGVKSCNQTRVEGQKIQPAGRRRNQLKANVMAPPGGVIAPFIGSVQLYLCLGTVKRARTSFLLFDLVFMFMQKSMAA